mmetsp:Transcript_15517/g.25889  ORF Transcript_15517/g.25889 Transcript_15517/m.25889 type:complete len:170 (-) Transcript_15517:9-518(-)
MSSQEMKAAAKDLRLQEKAAAKACLEQEKLAAKAKRVEVKAAAKALLEQEKIAAKAKRDADREIQRKKKCEAEFWRRFDLTSAVMRQSPEEVAKALEHRIDLLEDVDAGGHTPLICAATAGKAENVKLLIEHGANIETLDKCGENALIRAASRRGESYTDIIAYLRVQN